MKKLHFIKVTFCIVCLCCFSNYSCKKNPLKTFVVQGNIVNEAGNPISGATIKSGSSSSNSLSDGSFVLSSLLSSQGSFQLEANANGYFTGFKNLDNIDGSSLSTQIVLVQKNTLGTLNATNGGTVGATGLKVVAPANGFTQANGTAYTGTVTVASKYISKTNTNIANAMPGGDFTATDANGTTGGMRTYGFVATQFSDVNGNILTPNANVKVAVTLPTGVANPTTQGGQAWAYNNTTGKWDKPSPITVTGTEYFMPCITMYQNIDAFVPMGTLSGKVTCPNGDPVPFAIVTIQSSYDRYITSTNENGNFRVKVEATGGWSYTVSVSGGNVVTVSSVPANGASTASGLSSYQCGGSGTGTGSGQFTVNGNAYSGSCISIPDVSGCSGNDVTIVTPSGISFIIYNIPSASSGTVNFTDGYNNAGTCSLYALTSGLSIGTGTLASKTGTITKTGAKTFTFSCTIYDLSTNASYSATGSGNY